MSSQSTGMETGGAAGVSRRDDLTRIRGLDGATARALGGLGVSGFAEIAAWRAADVKRIRAALGLGRRIAKEQWIEQAAILASGRGTAFSPAVTGVAGTGAKSGASPTELAAAVAAEQRSPVAGGVPSPLPVSERAAPPRRPVEPVASAVSAAGVSPPSSPPVTTTPATTSFDAIFSRTPAPGQRRSLLAAIEAAEKAQLGRRLLPDSTTAPSMIAVRPPSIGAGATAGATIVTAPAVAPAVAKPTSTAERVGSAFGRAPQAVAARAAVPPTAREPSKPVAPRVVYVEEPGLADLAEPADSVAQRSANRTAVRSPSTASVVGRAAAERSTARPTSVSLSPHVGVQEEASVEIVHRSGAESDLVRRTAPAVAAPRPATDAAATGQSRVLSTFGRLFRGRGRSDP